MANICKTLGTTALCFMGGAVGIGVLLYKPRETMIGMTALTGLYLVYLFRLVLGRDKMVSEKKGGTDDLFKSFNPVDVDELKNYEKKNSLQSRDGFDGLYDVDLSDEKSQTTGQLPATISDEKGILSKIGSVLFRRNPNQVTPLEGRG